MREAEQQQGGLRQVSATERELRRAANIANHALASRERTEHEIRALLERRGCEPAAVARVLDDLAAVGLIDDARYAARFAEDKRELAGWGSDRIARDLQRRGVEQLHVDAALAGVGRDDELAYAVDLLCTRYREPLVDDRARNRAWQMLVRRGYEPELAYAAVRAHGHDLG
jgi:regulatory protein